MNTDYQIPEPFLFNPLKHHLGFIRESDCSQWTLKYHNNEIHYVHLFPARSGRDGSRAIPTIRVKSNTLKSALLYYILIGKDFITGDDLNKVRILLNLSPIKDTVDTEAILEMIEILRVSGSSQLKNLKNH